MRLAKVKEEHPDEWILVEVLEEGEEGLPEHVRLIEHSPDRADTYEAMSETTADHVAHFFNGEPPEDLVLAV